MAYCDVLVRDCVDPAEPAALPVRRGMPVQLSIPDSVAEAPWTVTVEYRTADDEVRYEHEVFTNGDQYAYTADPPGSDNQITVVEIQQISAAYATNDQGEINLDMGGDPQLVARGVWSLQVEPQ